MAYASTPTNTPVTMSRIFSPPNEAGNLCAADLHASDFAEFDEERTNVTIIDTAGTPILVQNASYIT